MKVKNILLQYHFGNSKYQTEQQYLSISLKVSGIKWAEISKVQVDGRQVYIYLHVCYHQSTDYSIRYSAFSDYQTL